MEAFDRWVEFAVETQARADTVTVFTHSRPEWGWARVENDVYLDDASLVVAQPGPVATKPVSQPAIAKPVSRLSAAAARLREVQLRRLLGDGSLPRGMDSVEGAIVPATPATSPSAGPTPASSGSRTHVIVPGDTLTNIAARYNTTVPALMQANNITNMDLIFLGLTLIIP
jgi:LysM repeat protein